uniref:Uncharacterized protein n=2 Tax=Brassica TaxID=3705 RepID=A0A0D2ZUU0_BRAOL
MASSSDDSEETGITKLKAEKEEVVVAAAAVVQDSQKKNPVDRSSCGLNTPSGSDAEIDALDKMEKEKEAGVTSELSNRRSKINNNNQTTDSWKEVSQGGRIAFQALFARERLPQSFSPPQVAENVNGKQSDRERSDSPFCLSPHNPKNLDLPPCSSISGDQKLL